MKSKWLIHGSKNGSIDSSAVQAIGDRYGILLQNQNLSTDVLSAIKQCIVIGMVMIRTKALTTVINAHLNIKHMQINKEELYRLYMEKVNRIAEDCDWVTSFGPEEIVDMIANILENNPHLISE